MIEKIYIKKSDGMYSISNDYECGVVVNVPSIHYNYKFNNIYYGINEFFKYAYENGYKISNNVVFEFIDDKKSFKDKIFNFLKLER